MKNYLSLVKFSHTIFAMPFALIGFFYAISQGGEFSARLFALTLLCMILARNAAMGFNRWADSDIDALNSRTAIREIPSGKISRGRAMLFVILNSVAFIIATWFINPLAFYLSPVALIVVLGYSLTKRFTSLCHLVLGLALSIAPVGAYIAVMGEFAMLPLIVALLVMLWCGGFDILYALQDEDFDRENSLHSIPQRLGQRGALLVSGIMHLMVVAIVAYIGMEYISGWLYIVGASLFSGMLVYEHIIVRPGDISKVNLAFATMNGLGSVVYGLFTILSLFF